jgi:hypothetical protein
LAIKKRIKLKITGVFISKKEWWSIAYYHVWQLRLKIELTDKTIEKYYSSDVLNLIRTPPPIFSIGPKNKKKIQ